LGFERHQHTALEGTEFPEVGQRNGGQCPAQLVPNPRHHFLSTT